MHYLEMFAFLGVIIPTFIGVDFFCVPRTKDEMITYKFYKLKDKYDIEYHIFTNTLHFLSDNVFFENTNINDKITLYHTPIFKYVTYASCKIEATIYMYELGTIWRPLLFFVCLTILLSIIVIIKAWGWKRKPPRVKYDSVVNLGVINALLCAIIIVAVLFQNI